MADNSKLYITISDERGGDGQTPTPKPNGEKKEDGDTLGRYIEHEMFHMAKQMATQAANFAISNIGNLSGDYAFQRKVNEVKQFASGIMSIGMATVAGAKYGGAVGAVIGFVTGTASTMMGGVFNVIQNNIENTKTNYEISQLRDRSGLNAVLDGSRGTEN